MKRTFVVISLALLSLDAGAQLSADARGRIDSYLSEAVSSTKIPGLVALVTDANEVIYEGAFGQRSIADPKPMTIDSIFRIASMTKPLTSTAVMILVDQGKVKLADPIERHLPALGHRQVIETVHEDGTYTARPAARSITITHLMTHTSGLAYGFSNEMLFKLTGGDFAKSAQGLPLVHDPGERWTYGESTRVLGSLVEAVTGESLDHYLATHLFAPLGMRDTSYVVPPAKIGRVATVHRMTEHGLVEDPNGDSVTAPDNGDGGLSSTAADYAAFIRMMLNDGVAADGARILTAESVASMGRGHTGAVRVSTQKTTMPMLSRDFPLGAGRDSYGLGFQVTGDHQRRDMRAPGSMSWAGIYNTEFWIDPANGIGGVLLMQYLPFYDEDAIATLQGFEGLVYEQLTPSP